MPAHCQAVTWPWKKATSQTIGRSVLVSQVFKAIRGAVAGEGENLKSDGRQVYCFRSASTSRVGHTYSVRAARVRALRDPILTGFGRFGSIAQPIERTLTP